MMEAKKARDLLLPAIYKRMRYGIKQNSRGWDVYVDDSENIVLRDEDRKDHVLVTANELKTDDWVQAFNNRIKDVP